MKNLKVSWLLMTTLVVSFALAAPAKAATIVYDGDGTGPGNWYYGDNWVGGVKPTVGDTAQFSGTASGFNQPVVTSGSGFYLGDIIDFQTAGWTLALNKSSSWCYAGDNLGGDVIRSAGSGTNTVTSAGEVFAIRHGNLNVAGGNTLVMNVDLTGETRINKTGDGTVILARACSRTVYNTCLYAGTMLVTNTTGSATGTCPTFEVLGGTFGGTGSISSSVAAYSGSTIAPGLPGAIGILTVNNSVDLGGATVKMDIHKSGASLTGDLLRGITTLSCGTAALEVTATGDSPAVGDSWNLFDAATFTGEFATLDLPTLAAGLSWDTSILYTDGTIRVVPEQAIFYAGVTAQGDGSGSSVSNAAGYLNSSFWDAVESELVIHHVKVILLDGEYSNLILEDMGDDHHRLTISGQTQNGVIFRNAYFGLHRVINCTVERVHFRGTKDNYVQSIRDGSHHVLIQDCTWEDLQIVNGASGVLNNSHHVTYKNCQFKRITSASEAHMIYCAFDNHHISLINCVFEDCTGEYVCFRDHTDAAEVVGCTFKSTSSAHNMPFISIPLYNDVNPGDEYFGTYYRVVDNTFNYYPGSGDRTAISFSHRGYDPSGYNNLMTAAEGAVLESGTVQERKELLLNNCGLDMNEVRVVGNVYSNVAIQARFQSYADYGAVSEGWEGAVTISDLLNQDDPVMFRCRNSFIGDFNEDQLVDLGDFEILASEWLSSSQGVHSLVDISPLGGDHRVDLDDFRALGLVWLNRSVRIAPNEPITFPIKNGNFECYYEANGSGYKPMYWNIFSGADSSFSIDFSPSHGKQCLSINDPSTSLNAGLISDKVPVYPGVNYTACASIKCAADSGQKAYIYVKFYDINGQVIAGSDLINDSTSTEWYVLKITGRAPAGAASAAVLLYSRIDKTGIIKFDDVDLYIADECTGDFDFALTEIGALPAGWIHNQSAGVQLVDSVKAIECIDSSAIDDAFVYLDIPADPGVPYILTAYMKESFTDNGAIYVKFLNSDKDVLAAYYDAENSSSWVPLSIEAIAPAGTVYARILFSSTAAGTGTGYVRNFSFRENYTLKYVSSTGAGLLDGSSIENAALYSNGSFWLNTVNPALTLHPVKVIFASGTGYGVSSLKFQNMGNDTYQLVMEGQSPHEVIFNAGNPSIAFKGTKNLIMRDLHFIDSSIPGGIIYSDYADYETKNITLDKCTFAYLPNVPYGIIGMAVSTCHDITLRNCQMINVGQALFPDGSNYDGSHMMYIGRSTYNYLVEDCHFEDGYGAYLKFRNDVHDITIRNNFFIQTGRYTTERKDFVRLEASNYNPSDPYDLRDELLPRSMTVTNNIFKYVGAVGVPFWMDADGVAVNHPQYFHVPLADKNILENVNAPNEDRNNLLIQHFGIDLLYDYEIKDNVYINCNSLLIVLDYDEPPLGYYPVGAYLNNLIENN